MFNIKFIIVIMCFLPLLLLSSNQINKNSIFIKKEVLKDKQNDSSITISKPKTKKDKLDIIKQIENKRKIKEEIQEANKDKGEQENTKIEEEPIQYKNLTELLIDIFSEIDFKDSQFSFTLLDEKGKIKASINKDLKLNQASVSKLIVSLAAIKYLGLNYRFKTNFYTDAEIDKDGVLDGNLIIKGFGDPNLLVQDIYKIIDFLKLIGLKEIKGNIIFDLSYFDKKYSISELKPEDTSRAYAAYNNALPLNYNSVKFSIKPYYDEEKDNKTGEKSKKNTSTSLSNHKKNTSTSLSNRKKKKTKDDVKVYVSYPSSLMVRVKNKLSLSKRYSRLKAETKPKRYGYTELELKGRVNRKLDLLVFYRRIENPDYYFAKIFYKLLKYSRIKVKGRLKLRYTNQVFRKTDAGFKYKKNIKFLYSHQTKYLLDTLIIMNRYSNNFIAEQLLKIIGAKTSKTDTEFGVGSWKNGLKAINKMLVEDIKLNPKNYQYKNASGLNDSNFFTSNQITKMLHYVKSNFDYKWYLLSSLPKIGVSGTLRRYCLSEDCKGAVIAKTGSLRTTVALAGFLNFSKKTYTFSLAINFKRSKKKFRKLIIKAKKLMTNITELENL